MKKRRNNSDRASALPITLSVPLISMAAILLASIFNAAPLARQPASAKMMSSSSQAFTLAGKLEAGNVLFSDDFDDNSIDPSRWTTSGVRIEESSGLMRVLTDATDNGGVLVSQPFALASRNPVTITRQVYVHRANENFCGYIAMRFGGLPWSAVYYANHSYTDVHFLQRFGLFSGRNVGTPDGAWVHAIARDSASDITGPYGAVLWDTWFNESIVYTPDTGIMEYYINSQKMGEQLIGIMPTTNTTMQLAFRAWGWNTGHQEVFDNIQVTQEASPTPTPITLSIHQVLPTASPSRIQNINDNIDAQLLLKPDETLLRNQPTVSQGLVADGVTPLLIQIDANPAPTQPITLTLGTTIEKNDGTLTNGLSSHLRVLQTSGTPQFVMDNSIVLSPAHPSGFAYISGIKSEDVHLNTLRYELSATLIVQQNGTNVATKNFLIRKPPIILVHGYNSDNGTWYGGEGDFIGVLANYYRLNNFIFPVEYGVDRTETTAFARDKQNRVQDFVTLAGKLDAALPKVGPSGPFSQWAMTRYDLVCHSQGGVLARMLCATNPANFGIGMKFKDPRNANRGRFRRIVTIGAPQNGSTVEYYANRYLFFNKANPNLLFAIGGAVVRHTFVQEKFNPFGTQIQNLNNAANAIDPDAKFHVIRGAIASNNTIFGVLRLNRPAALAAVIPNGSDGIADFESQTAAQSGPAVNTVPGNTAHCCPEFSSLAFGVPPVSLEPTSFEVATEVVSYLNGPAEAFFAPFQIPTLLDANRKAAIDSTVLQSLLLSILSVIPHPSPDQNTPAQFDLFLTPDPQEPIDGTATWSAETFGPNGVSSDGLTLEVNPTDSTMATLTVADDVQGDVVVYGNYPSANGRIIVGRPIVVLSRPVGSNLVGISLQPNTLNATLGDSFAFQVWGNYDNGMTAHLFEPSQQPAQYSTSDPAVVSISDINHFTAVGIGQATITGNFRGFSAQSAVQVSPAPSPLPNFALVSVVSRKTHGTAGSFDIDLPLTGNPGVECRSTGGDYTLVFKFSNGVADGGAGVTNGTGNVVGPPTFEGNTMVVNLTGVANAQQIIITINGVIDTFSQILPEQTVAMNVLTGDTNANGAVNSADVAQTKARLGQAVDTTNFRSDVNTNGAINAGDVSQIKSLLGTGLP